MEKVAVITGATSGIGLATAKSLATKDYTIVALGRNAAKGEKAIKEIDSAGGDKTHKFYVVDLSSQESIKVVCERLQNDYAQVKVLVNNAATLFSTYKESVDGVEMQWAVNHLGYYLMTMGLLPLLKASENARIVNVASSAHLKATMHWDDPELKSDYNITQAYGQSKLANVMFTRALAKRLKPLNICVFAAHPGLVKTKLGSKKTNLIHSLMWRFFSSFGVKSDEGAATSVYLATAPDIEELSGKYFAECKEAEINPLAEDDSACDRLWALSQDYIKVDFPAGKME